MMPTTRVPTEPTIFLCRSSAPQVVLAVCLVAIAPAFLSANTDAGVVFNEAIDGDISDDRFAPTLLSLGQGSNTLAGTFGISPTPDMPDLDYITITVPEGFVLDQFIVAAANVGGAFSFVGIEAGTVVTIPWDWSSVNSPLLGWAHFGSGTVGVDILPDLGNAPGAVGFDGALGAGTYALWIMELNTSRDYSYAFDLHLTAVPTPGAVALVSIALAMGGLGRRRRRRRLFVFFAESHGRLDQSVSQR